MGQDDGSGAGEHDGLHDGELYECRHMWSLAFRRQFRLLGSNTNNFVEWFFRAVKAAVELVRRTRPHIAECIRIVLEFACESIQSSSYLEHMQEFCQLKVSIPEYAALFNVTSKSCE